MEHEKRKEEGQPGNTENATPPEGEGKGMRSRDTQFFLPHAGKEKGKTIGPQTL